MKWFKRRGDELPPVPMLPKAGRPPGLRATDSVAPIIASIAGPHLAEVTERLLTHAAGGAPILDVGTGPGVTPATHDTVVGTDRSEAVLRAGARRRVAAADPLDLPFKDNTFASVLSTFGLAEARDLRTAMFELIRVTRSGGTVIAASWGAERDELSALWTRLVTETLGVELARQIHTESEPGADLLAQPTKVEQAFRDAGLRPVTVERIRMRFDLARDDYIAWREVEPFGRGVAAALGPKLWPRFQERVRVAFADAFPERLGDWRDIVVAVGTKPA